MIYSSWAMKLDVNSLKHFINFNLNSDSSKLATGMVTDVTSTTGISKRQSVRLLSWRCNTSYSTTESAAAVSGHSYYKDNYT